MVGNNRFMLLICASMLLALFSSVLHGQEYRGRVQGQVTDSSSAVIAGATVTLRNIHTGVQTVRQTNQTGHYLFDLVQPGSYAVIAESRGFNKTVQPNVLIQSFGDVTVDLMLKPGAATETITVSAQVSSVEFNSSKVETTLNSSLMDSLPQEYRNPFIMATLDPSVEPDPGYSAVQPYQSWGSNRFSAGGGGIYGNNIQVDGSQVSTGVKTGYVPSPDEVQEISIQVNPVDAEYGHSSGGSVSIVLKSGTNEYHGTGFYQGQYPWANAIEDRYYRTVNEDRNQIFGGTFGNRIKKNKLFNFVSYEQWKYQMPNSMVATLPTDLERKGDYSQSLNGYGGQRTIYNPWTTTTALDGTVTRQPFAGNVIPGSMQNSIATGYLSKMWEPNGTGSGPDHENNYSAASPEDIGYKNFSDRVDWNVNDKLRIYGRASVIRTPDLNVNPTGSSVYLAGGAQRNGTNYAGDAIYTLNAHTVINVHGDYHNLVDAAASDTGVIKSWAEYWPNSNWYTSLFPSGEPIFVPRMSMHKGLWNTLNNLGEGAGFWKQAPAGDSFNIKVAQEDGKHYFKWGAETIGTRANSYLASSPGFAFYSDLTAKTYLNPDLGASGDAYATFLLGPIETNDWNWVEDTEFPNLVVAKPENRFFGLYINDDWKISSRLTLNLGLRYEYEQPYSDPENRAPRFLDLTSPIPQMQNAPQMPDLVKQYYSGGWTYNGAFQFTDSSNPYAWNGGLGVLLPRAGAAYRLNDKTALRAAYGRYASPWTQVSTNMTSQGPTSLLGFGYPGFDAYSWPQNPINGVPQMTVQNPFPSSYPLTVPQGKLLGRNTGLGDSLTWTYPDRPKQTSDRFNFSVQRQLPLQALLDVTYFFNWTHNTMDNNVRNLNAVDPRLTYQYGAALSQTIANPFYNYLLPDQFPGPLRYQQETTIGALMVPYPQYGALNVEEYPGGAMKYQSIQVKLQKAFGQGFSLLLAYNYHYEQDTEFFDDVASYLRDWSWMQSLNSRHRLSGAGTWALPFGKGRQFLTTAPRLLDAAVGGWNVAGVLSWHSGSYLGFGNMLVTGDPTANVPAGDYFNPAVFQAQPAYTERTNPWYYSGLTGPGMFNLDASLTKNFAITEKSKFELRMDAFNALNGFTPGDVDMSLGDSSFGQTVGQYSTTYGRRLQLGLKVIF